MGGVSDDVLGSARFVHLRLHSSYSLLEGALKIEKIAKAAKADGMLALAVTDTNNLFAALEFSEKLAGAGLQPIIGSTLTVRVPQASGEASGRSLPGSDSMDLCRIALIAKSEEGYANLMDLSSRLYLESGAASEPSIGLEEVLKANSGLICLTGGPDGPIDKALQAGQGQIAEVRLSALKDAFQDRLYVEIQRHGLERQAAIEPDLLALAYDMQLPIVASNECYFLEPGDFEAHDALICISQGSHVSVDDRRRLTKNHHFKSQSEMVKLFADLPEAIENTLEITRRVAFRPVSRKPILPQFVSSAEAAGAAAQAEAEGRELTRQAVEGLRAQLAKAGLAQGHTREDYEKRLAFELSVIIRMQYQGYFLIVSDFIKWAKAQGIPVGPGRGSGAGSVVAWALTITDLDPMRFGLLFERFLNPERVSMPDFDIDFCQERRDEVIRYVQGKYGPDRVAQIITFGRLQARAVLRDVGRVLQMPYGQVDRLCKLVPNNPANPVTLDMALQTEAPLREARDAEPAVAQLIDIALKLEGLNRNASTHAAGIVIADRPLTKLVPLYRDPRSELPATQFNMKWVEQAGLVKFDFLGLKTLSVLRRAEELVRSQERQEFDIARLPLDDAKSYELMSRGDTAGVFQLESTGMRDALRKLRPDRFEDIIAMVALYRPGPMDNIPTYVNRKHGAEPVTDLHPMLTPILAETYGVIIYQEQVMQIAQVLSGYSLGEADLLRRAMGKKIKEEMAQQRQRFVDGAVRNGVEAGQAGSIFDLVDKFAGYGFNKSHAAAYALIAYQTAFLKANHPVAFLAASMTFDMSNTDKLAMFCDEARRMGVGIKPPDINRSGVAFLPEDGGIRYALAALKNVGGAAAQSVVSCRSEGRPFETLARFAESLDAKAVNKRVLETFAAAGAFDQLEPNRARAHANCDAILALAQRTAENRLAGQNDLFAADRGAAAKSDPLQLKAIKPWPAMTALANEQNAVGFYLSGHPLDEYGDVLSGLQAVSYDDFARDLGEGISTGVLAGVVIAKRDLVNKKGNRFAFAAFSDRTGQFECILFSDVLADAAAILEPGKAVIVHVEANRQGDEIKLKAQYIQSLDKAAGANQRGLRIVLEPHVLSRDPSALGVLKDLLHPGGRGEVRLVVPIMARGREVELRLKGRFQLSPEMAARIEALPCVRSIAKQWDAGDALAA